MDFVAMGNHYSVFHYSVDVFRIKLILSNRTCGNLLRFLNPIDIPSVFHGSNSIECNRAVRILFCIDRFHGIY